MTSLPGWLRFRYRLRQFVPRKFARCREGMTSSVLALMVQDELRICRADFGSIFVLAKFFLYVRRKFTDAIYNDSNPGLREYALISLNYKRGIVWIPSCTDYPGSECRRKRHDIWADGLFGAVISYEISNERVTETSPTSCASAAVIARLPSNYPLTERGE